MVHVLIFDQGKRFLKGSERNQIVEELLTKNMTPNAFHLEKMANASIEEIMSGNMTKTQNANVFKKALYVARRQENLCENVHNELIIMNEVVQYSLNAYPIKGYI